MRLIEYIERVGDHKAAERFGVAVMTARNYRLGTKYPGSRLAGKLPELTGGMVTRLDEVFPVNSAG